MSLMRAEYFEAMGWLVWAAFMVAGLAVNTVMDLRDEREYNQSERHSR